MVTRALVICLSWMIVADSASAEKYANYQEAYAAAQKTLRERNFSASQEPLEAAVEFAPDDKTRIRLYRQLFFAYRIQPEIQPMVTACEFILDHSDSSSEKQLTRSALLSFIRERGKDDALIEHFQQRLQASKEDQTALFVLSDAYDRLKQDPAQSAAYTERLIQAMEQNGEKADVNTYAHLGLQYFKTKEFEKSAQIYEKIAPRDEALAAWYWEEAATAWLKAGRKENALKAAKESSAAEPEKRTQSLIYHWNRGLGDAYLELNEPALAIPYLEKALQTTKIEGYREATQVRLDAAKRLAN